MAPLTGTVAHQQTSRRALIGSMTLFMLLGLSWSLFTLRGCDKTPADAGKMEMKLGGKSYVLEIVDDDAKRTLGMGGRTVIPDGTGMIFVFKNSVTREFLMRDCPISIDIIFLDGAQRVTAMHTMTMEEPRKSTETPFQYESRLKKYSSRFSCQFAIEIAAGATKGLNIKPGDKLEFDGELLKKRAK